MSKSRKKKSQDQEAIEAVLLVALEHAELIEAAKRSTEQNPAPAAVTK